MTKATASVAMVAAAFVMSFTSVAADDADDFNYLVGRGIRDVTGPPVGVQMWGFVREGQTTEGIHLRLWSRAIIIAQPDEPQRVALATVDLGSIPHPIKQAVVDRLGEKFGTTYRHDNVVIAATHTHAGPGGYFPGGAGSPLVPTFIRTHFDKIVEGIFQSLVAAHDDLEPGAVYIGKGRLKNVGAQRSRVAYDNNPAAERARYDSDTDQQMTLLKVVDASGPIATLNWFAVHPTSMTYNNRLISGDHKGYASAAWEMMKGTTYDSTDDFVAAFAQSNCGDVTANLNLDNTGPGANDFQSTQIIGERQLAKAVALFNHASERLQGPIATLHKYVDFSRLQVDKEFTKAGAQRTSPSAYGYAFAAGSTEDGGGHPLFHEGMTEREERIDALVGMMFKIKAPTDELRAAHAPKAILFAPGAAGPNALQSQILPLGLVRIGQLGLIVGPAEFTTMAGRRIRATVGEELGDDVPYLVIAGYANGYAGYVTTKQEYDTQQYEGGHTLFGPWTLAGYQQQYAQLAAALSAGTTIGHGPTPSANWRTASGEPLDTDVDLLPPSGSLGEIAASAKNKYRVGELVEVIFWTGNPNNDFGTMPSYMTVERRDNDGWTVVATDRDWQTKCIWRLVDVEVNETAALQITLTWDIPAAARLGTYRLGHHGHRKLNADQPGESISTWSQPFGVE